MSPIEVQVYSFWFCAMYPEKLSPSAAERLMPKADIAFPGIAKANRTAQLAMGFNAIRTATETPGLMNHPQTERSL
jgi:hypothetical protein